MRLERKRRRSSPLTGEENRSLLGDIQPFLLVLENLTYRASLNSEDTRNLLLFDVGVIAVVDAYLLSIDVVQTLFPMLWTVQERWSCTEWHWGVLRLGS